MITLKYTKTDSAVFISHIDILRHMVRIMRRAKLNVKFSNGFNPHMLLFFSPPLALGVTSKAEYVTVDIDDIEPKDFLNAFNKAVPQGIVGLDAFYTAKSPNLAAKIVMAKYQFKIKDFDKTAKLIEYFKNNEHYEITYKQKNEYVTKDVRQQIISIEPYNEGLIFGLSTGNSNLRADRFLDALIADFNIKTNIFEIQKIAQFVKNNDGFTDVHLMLSAGGNLEKVIY